MARDLGEQERAFVHSLAQDTGRDLSGWMRAIAESGHAKRNDIIDWLRHQGFTFSNASWLERIHHNGGALIYGDQAPALAIDRSITEPRARVSAAPAPPAPAETAAADAVAAQATVDTVAAKAGNLTATDGEPARAAAPIEPKLRAVAAKPADRPAPPVSLPQPPPARETPQASASEADIAQLLMAAKGLKPLAEFILRELDGVVPASARLVDPPFLMIASPMPFAALLPAPKDVRLYADFGPGSRDRARKAENGRIPAPFPDVIVLSDARQIDERFRELVAAAYTRALK